MTPTFKKSTRIGAKRAQAVAALLQAHSVGDAAQVVGVSTRTLQRWKSDPAFAAALLDAQSEIFHCVSVEVRSLALDAVRTLGQVLRDEKSPTPSRVRASAAILAMLTKTHDREVIEARLTRLEHGRKQCRTR
jgi:hypothetical protein